MSVASRIADWLLRESKDNPAFAQYSTDNGHLPQPVTMSGNPKILLKEGYKGNVTAYKCISYIARNAAQVRPVLYEDATCKREIESDLILDFLKSPNASMSFYDFAEDVCSYTLATGNSYMCAIRTGASGPPDEIWSLEPDKIDIVPNGRMVQRYDYKVKQPPTPLDPRLVGHTKFWNPDDNLYGLSPIQVASIYLDMNSAYNKWNLALTQNSGQPAGAWVVPTVMDRRSRDLLEDKLNKKYLGAKNAGKIPVLDGGLTFNPTGIPPQQMAWLEARGLNANEIANVYSLYPQLVNDTSASTDNNMEAAKYSSYTEAIFPLLDKFYGTLRRWLVPMFGSSTKFLTYDKQSVETIQKMMQEQESAKAERYTKIWLAGGMLLSDYQEAIKVPVDPQGKIYRVKDLLIAQADMKKYAEQCLTAPAEQTLPVPEGTSAPVGGVTPKPGIPPTKPTKPAPAKPPKKASDEDDSQLSVSHFALQENIYKQVDNAPRDESAPELASPLMSLYDSDRARYKALLKGTGNKTA